MFPANDLHAFWSGLMTNAWIIVDRDGLRQVNERLVERRGFGMIGGELYQNVMDTTATECKFTIEKVPGKPRITIECEDNGPGFTDLTHAWTMYAPSEKKGDPTKAGRFNIGEKIVLSFAASAQIHTTSGTVIFDDSGMKPYPRRKRENGTVFWAELKCKQEYFEQLIEYMHRIIVRPGLTLTVNGEEIPHREPLDVLEYQLPTEIGDELRRTVRNTEVQIYEPSGDEVAMLYELGIPVVETEDKWHVSVQQKVPLNTERTNVTPSYLRQVRVAVFNHMHRQIEEEDTTSTWVNEAASDPKCDPEAATTFMHKKYGENSVASDPSNPEADGKAMANGWTVIPSRGLTSGQRDNLKASGSLLSSSKQFPTHMNGGPFADDVKQVTANDDMKLIEEYAKGLAQRLLNISLTVEFVHSVQWNAVAGYATGHLSFNVFRLGKRWFAKGATKTVDELIIHELAHDFASNHLSEDYHEGICTLAARLKVAALEEPEWFRKFMK